MKRFVSFFIRVDHPRGSKIPAHQQRVIRRPPINEPGRYRTLPPEGAHPPPCIHAGILGGVVGILGFLPSQRHTRLSQRERGWGGGTF